MGDKGDNRECGGSSYFINYLFITLENILYLYLFLFREIGKDDRK